MRVVSLIASSTEMTCALGRENQLVGISHECDFPETIKHLPRCSEPKFHPDGKSYEIDQRIKAILQEGLSIYRVDADLLKRLAPDVILTQIQCEVCAVSEQDVLNALQQWNSPQTPTVVALNPNCLEDIWRDFRRVGTALDAEPEATQWITHAQSRIQDISQLAQAQTSRPRIACIEWIEPLMAAGNWVPELIELAGGTNLFGKAGKHSPWMTTQELIASDPEIILVMPCGFNIARTLQEIELLENIPDWAKLSAVKSRQVYVVDGNQYFNRPGPRILDSLEILVELIHPAAVKSPRYEGNGWVRR